MNIFMLEYRNDNESIKSYARRVAQSHCDLHQKQILEAWQMLNTNCNVLGIKTDNSSKAYVNHPCTVWARSSLENWQFLYHLAEELAIEFQKRNNKRDLHKSWTRILENVPYNANEAICGSLTPSPMAMPDSITNASENDPVAAYRAYYNTHKAYFSRRTKVKGTFGQDLDAYSIKPASWKNQDNPVWWNPVSLDDALSLGYIKATGQNGKQFVLSSSDRIIFK